MSILYDISAYTGATVVSENHDMKISRTNPVSVVGKISEAHIDKSKSVLIGEINSKLYEDRVSFLENFVKENPALGDFDIECLQERISKLRGGLTVIQPGGTT